MDIRKYQDQKFYTTGKQGETRPIFGIFTVFYLDSKKSESELEQSDKSDIGIGTKMLNRAFPRTYITLDKKKCNLKTLPSLTQVLKSSNKSLHATQDYHTVTLNAAWYISLI